MTTPSQANPVREENQHSAAVLTSSVHIKGSDRDTYIFHDTETEMQQNDYDILYSRLKVNEFNGAMKYKADVGEVDTELINSTSTNLLNLIKY